MIHYTVIISVLLFAWSVMAGDHVVFVHGLAGWGPGELVCLTVFRGNLVFKLTRGKLSREISPTGALWESMSILDGS